MDHESSKPLYGTFYTCIPDLQVPFYFIRGTVVPFDSIGLLNCQGFVLMLPSAYNPFKEGVAVEGFYVLNKSRLLVKPVFPTRLLSVDIDTH